ncbi:MAG: hypothetical protein AMXMBFR13_35170 [Phycisphaerae bacterium]
MFIVLSGTTCSILWLDSHRGGVTDQPLVREATSHAFEPEEQACAFSAEQAVPGPLMLPGC